MGTLREDALALHRDNVGKADVFIGVSAANTVTPSTTLRHFLVFSAVLWSRCSGCCRCSCPSCYGQRGSPDNR